MQLSEVIAHLSEREGVDGILTIGTTADGKLSLASDYDLVLVLSSMPVPLQVALTYIDERLADVIFITTRHIKEVLALEEPIDGDEWLGRIVRWLLDGELQFDRSGLVSQAQQKVRQGEWLRPVERHRAYDAWFKINFNLAQTRRLLASQDPIYLQAADLRMALYGPSDLLFGYWAIRGLRWEGDKAAVRYLSSHDPTYLEMFLRFIQEKEREPKMALYRRLAAATTAPADGLWSQGIAAVVLDGVKATPERIEAGLGFWHDLTKSRD
jgi:hypothetical protein